MDGGRPVQHTVRLREARLGAGRGLEGCLSPRPPHTHTLRTDRSQSAAVVCRRLLPAVGSSTAGPPHRLTTRGTSRSAPPPPPQSVPGRLPVAWSSPAVQLTANAMPSCQRSNTLFRFNRHDHDFWCFHLHLHSKICLSQTLAIFRSKVACNDITKSVMLKKKLDGIKEASDDVELMPALHFD